MYYALAQSIYEGQIDMPLVEEALQQIVIASAMQLTIPRPVVPSNVKVPTTQAHLGLLPHLNASVSAFRL